MAPARRADTLPTRSPGVVARTGGRASRKPRRRRRAASRRRSGPAPAAEADPNGPAPLGKQGETPDGRTRPREERVGRRRTAPPFHASRTNGSKQKRRPKPTLEKHMERRAISASGAARTIPRRCARRSGRSCRRCSRWRRAPGRRRKWHDTPPERRRGSPRSGRTARR